MSEIGFIGLGRMGAGMAARLLAAGHRLHVHDLDAGAVAALVAKGALAAGSAAGVGRAADVVLVSLPNPDIVHAALLGPDGVAGGGRVATVIDLSTSGAQMAQRLAAELAGHGIASYDAPVSGGVKGAREGTLALMVAGPEEGWPEVQALLGHLGKPFYMGAAPGAGQTMKLVNNLLGAVAIAVTAEGMTMGIKAGLEPARMIEVLNQSTGRNSATQDKWPRAVLPRTFDFGFTAGLSLKDMRLCAAEAQALGVPLAMGDIAISLLERTVAAFGETSDFTGIARVVEREAGLDLEGPG